VTRIYDLVMTHKLDADDLFIHRVQQHCAEQGLNFFLVEPVWVEPFCDLFAKGKIWARALLNMHSEHHLPEDIYHRLIRLAHERNTQVIDPPDVAAAAFDKARLHPRLADAGFKLPFTLIVPREQVETWVLSDKDRAALGTPFVIKPGMGYGKRGVIMDATSERDLARSVALWPDRHYLVQNRIVPRVSNGEPAYFRVFHVFGSVWCCWWNCFTDRYRLPSRAEEEQLALTPRDTVHRIAFGVAVAVWGIHFLTPLRDIVHRIAALTGMKFFSSEIALTESGEFVLIDYVNDQCHMLSQSANPQMGVPDELVSGIARRLVEGVSQMIRR
jgi:hypothetical protein